MSDTTQVDSQPELSCVTECGLMNAEYVPHVSADTLDAAEPEAVDTPVTLPFQLHPQHDRIVDDAQAVQSNADSLSLAEVERMLSAHPDGLSKATAQFLVRIVKSMNSRVAELERELKQKDADYTGVCLEYQDVSDENNRLKQDLEIQKIVADARAKTLLEVKEELETLKAASTA